MNDQERLRAIWDRSVEKLKEVVREFDITEDELHIAGAYFNRLGQSGMCPSLIDVALAMTSIDAKRQRSHGGTRANLTGPYHAQHPVKADGNLCDTPPAPDAPRLEMSGVVTDVATGQPIAGAEVDFWHADHNGIYDRQGNHLRGIVPTDEQGRYRINTLLPNDYSEHDFDPLGELFRAMGRTNTRAAHVHVKVCVNGVDLLTTQLFMSTSNMLKDDYVEGAVTDDLIVALQKREENGVTIYSGQFDIAVAPETSAATAS